MMRFIRAYLFFLLFGLGQVTLVFAQEAEPHILITEIYYHSLGDDSLQEWVEIANFSSSEVDISNYKLGDEESVGGGEGMMRFPRDAAIAADEVVVVARTAAGFMAVYGLLPNYEMLDTHPDVPNMRVFRQWSDGEVALNNQGDELLLLNAKGRLVDSLNYGESVHYFEPSILDVAKGQSIERVPADCDSDSAGDWQPQLKPAPGVVTLTGDCEVVEVIAEEAASASGLAISTIQGSGDSSPMTNEVVVFEGVVTVVVDDRNSSGVTFYTVYVQDSAETDDHNPATSNGIGVFTGRTRPPAHIGDRVRVTGQVTEYFGLTEISDDGLKIEVLASDMAQPEPVLLTADSDLESLEGMRVTLGTGTLPVKGPTYDGCGFAVGWAASAERIIRHSRDEPIEGIISIQNASDTRCDTFPDVKVGDGIAGLSGVLSYTFEQYRLIIPNPEKLSVTTAPLTPPPILPMVSAEQFSLATFNVENYFDAIDDTGQSFEPKLSPETQAIKRTKIAYAITQLLHCPTFVGIQEVENEQLLHDLVEEMAPACGFTYQISHRPSPDARGIDVALLSQPNSVTILGVNLRQGCTAIDTGIVDAAADCQAQSPLFSRPPLQVDAILNGQPLTIFVNHFKSKRGGEAATEPRRVAQAAYLGKLVDTLLVKNPGAHVFVIGDLNDFDGSLAVQTLKRDGHLLDLLATVPEAERYSFVFGGVSQLIDGLLASPAAAEALVSAHILHTNADYPDAFGEIVSAELLPYKATDHDIPYAIFTLPAAPQANAPHTPEPRATAAPATLPKQETETAAPSPFIFAGAAAIGLVLIIGISKMLKKGRPTPH